MNMAKAALLAGGLSLTLAACEDNSEAERAAIADEIKAELKAEMEAEAEEAEEAEEKAETKTAAAPAPEAEAKPAAPKKSGWRNVSCKISTYSDSYSGPCQFRSEKGGSFAVQRADEGAIVDDVSLISLTVTARGVGQVSGLTTYGNNSRWGEAYRSQADKSCWVGDEFEVCAY